MKREFVNSYVVNCCVFEKYFKLHYDEIVNGDINKYSVGELLDKTYSFIPKGEIDDGGCTVDIHKLVKIAVEGVGKDSTKEEAYDKLEGYYINNPEAYIDSVIGFCGNDFVIKKQPHCLRAYVEGIVFNVALELVINEMKENKNEVVD